MKRIVIRSFAISQLLVACGSDGSCPQGSVRLGGACVPSAEQPDAALPDSPAPRCGDGRLDPGEDCDGGNGDDSDGCSSACSAEDPCALNGCAPEPPVVRGAPSMAPGRELFTWSEPEGATRIELRLDERPLATPAEARLSTRLDEGEHTLAARACNDAGCSDWAELHTVVEAFGRDLPVGLEDTGRALTRTSLGHPVAIGCADCANNDAGESLAADAAAGALTRALSLGSDLVGLSVASIEGDLVVATSDRSSAAELPRLDALLNVPAVRDGDALLMLDLVENEPRLAGALSPSAFAAALVTTLEAVPLVARNGRPLLVRTTYAHRGYLSALRSALAGCPELAPYVRYVLRDPEGRVDDLYALDALSQDAPLVPSLDFVDAVSFGHDAPDLSNRITLSRRAGRAVIVDGVPGSATQGGHAVITALRDRADVLVTRYLPDRAQQLVKLATHQLYFDGSHVHEGDQSVDVQFDEANGTPGSTLQTLANFASPLTERDATSGLLPPGVRFNVDRSGMINSAPDTLSSSDGFMVSVFGSLRGSFAVGDGRVFVAIAQPPNQQFIINTTQGTDALNVTDADFVAACGRSLGQLLSPSTSHWLVVHGSTDWTVSIDGTCAVTKRASWAVPATSVSASSPRVLATDASLSAVAMARLPPTYASDRGL